MEEVREFGGGAQVEDANTIPMLTRGKAPHVVIIDSTEFELTVKVPLRYFRCSITKQLTANPVLLSGVMYDETAIQQYLNQHDYVDPLGNRVVRDKPLITDMFRKNLYAQVKAAVDKVINDDAVTLTIDTDDLNCAISFDQSLVPYCIPNSPKVYNRSVILDVMQRQIQPQMEARRARLQQFEDDVEAGVVAHINQNPFEVIDREQVKAEVRARLLAARNAEPEQPLTCRDPSTNASFQFDDLYLDKFRLAIGMAKFKNTIDLTKELEDELLAATQAIIRPNLMDCITFAIFDGDKALVDKLLTLLTREDLEPNVEMLTQEELALNMRIRAISAVFVGDLQQLEALNYNANEMNPLLLRYAFMARKDRIFTGLLQRPGNWSWVLNFIIESLKNAIEEKNDLMLDFILSQVFLSEVFTQRVLVGDNGVRRVISFAELPPGAARFFNEFMSAQLDRSRLFNFVNKALIVAATEKDSHLLQFIWTRILLSNTFRQHIPQGSEPPVLLREIVSRQFPQGALLLYQAPETKALLRAPAEIGFLTACRNADTTMVAWCLERDPGINSTAETLRVALDIVLATRNSDLIQLFMERAKSAPADLNGQSSLQVNIETALKNGHDQVVHMIVEDKDFNWGQLYTDQQTIFHLCCAQDNPRMLEWLLPKIPADQQSVLTLRNSRGNTALSGAINNRLDCALVLIRAGAGVFLLDKDNRSPIMQATAMNRPSLVTELKQFYTANVGLIADMLIQQHPWLVDKSTYKLNMPLVQDWAHLKSAVLAYLKAKELGGANTCALLKKIRVHIATQNSALRQFFNLKEGGWSLSRRDPISRWSADLQKLDEELASKIALATQLSPSRHNDNNGK